MPFKIGPPRARGICVGCRNGQVTEFETGGSVTWCNNLMKPFQVMRPVVRCTDFEDRQRESEFEMRKIAWTLSTDKKGAPTGFHPPKKKNDD